MSLVVEAARRWLGTPYLHQASHRTAGTDCLGLVRGVWRELFGKEPVPVPPYTPDWAEPQQDEILERTAHAVMLAVEPDRELRSGEVLLFRMRDGAVAKHLGILAELGDAPSFIHAYSGHGVVESSLSTPWVRRIVGRFDFPPHH